MPRYRLELGILPSLPPLPAGVYNKAYYAYLNTVYYLADGMLPSSWSYPGLMASVESDTEWSRGIVSNETKSTSLYIVSAAYLDDVNDF
jgi:hypothetical protein